MSLSLLVSVFVSVISMVGFEGGVRKGEVGY